MSGSSMPASCTFVPLSDGGADPTEVYVSEADAHWLGIEPKHLVTWSGSIELVDGEAASTTTAMSSRNSSAARTSHRRS